MVQRFLGVRRRGGFGHKAVKRGSKIIKTGLDFQRQMAHMNYILLAIAIG
jgi:hypothetical protein